MRVFLRYWVPLLVWMLLIFILSHQDGETSSKTSEWVVSILEFLHLDLATVREYGINLLVRKAAHMTEYFILYLLIFRLLRFHRTPLRSMLIASLLFTAAYAATDEFHQIWIPGRVGTIVDVGIDSIGATFALLLCWLRHRTKD